MLYASSILALAALPAVFCAAVPACDDTDNGNFTIYNPPTLSPYIHIDLIVSQTTNVTTIDGVTARFPTLGGNVTGELTGEVLPLGAAFERIPATGDGSRSFLQNKWTLNVTAPSIPDKYTTLLIDVDAIIFYANTALHAFGNVRFSTAEPSLLGLNYDSFVAELDSNFATGKASLDIFRFQTGGRRDGQPILALLPPGQGA